MRDSDPLEDWAYRRDATVSPELAAARLQIAQTALNKLEAYPNRPNKKVIIFHLRFTSSETPCTGPRQDKTQNRPLLTRFKLRANGGKPSQQLETS